MVAEGSSPPSRTPPASGGDATSRSADSAGAYLQSLRLARGASLDDIARATRVGRRHIEALEADEAAELPAPVFVKGFIRAYCEFLQAKPDEALERYRRHAPAHIPRPLRLRLLPTHTGQLARAAEQTRFTHLALRHHISGDYTLGDRPTPRVVAGLPKIDVLVPERGVRAVRREFFCPGEKSRPRST